MPGNVCGKPTCGKVHSVQCNECAEWWHQACAGVDAATTLEGSWKCKKCKLCGQCRREISDDALVNDQRCKKCNAKVHSYCVDEESFCYKCLISNAHSANAALSEQLEQSKSESAKLQLESTESLKAFEEMESEITSNTATVLKLNDELRKKNEIIIAMQSKSEEQEEKIDKLETEYDKKQTQLLSAQEECATLYKQMNEQKKSGVLDDEKLRISSLEIENQNLRAQLEELKKTSHEGAKSNETEQVETIFSPPPKPAAANDMVTGNRFSEIRAVIEKSRRARAAIPSAQVPVGNVSLNSTIISVTGAAPKSTYEEMFNSNKLFLHPSASQLGPSNVELPPMTGEEIATQLRRGKNDKLPKFDGNVLEWPSFLRNYEMTTRQLGYYEYENIIRLREALSGEALTHVKTLLNLGTSATGVMELLAKKFGKPEVILRVLTEMLTELPKIQHVIDSNISRMSTAVQEYVVILRSIGREQDITNSFLLDAMEAKLCPDLFREWARVKREIAKSNRLANFDDFSEYLLEAADEIPDVTTHYKGEKKDEKDKITKRFNSHQIESKSGPFKSNSANVKPSCLHCNRPHNIKDCQDFRKLSVAERKNFINEKNACFKCLSNKRHEFKRCRIVCTVEGCGYGHSFLLHEKREPSSTNSGVTRINSNAHIKDPSVLHKVVPIRLFCGEGPKYYDTYAMFDDCSGGTFIDEAFFDRLEVPYENVTLKTVWTGDHVREDTSKKATIQIAVRGSDARFDLKDTFTIKNLNLASQTVDCEKLKEKYSHLRNLPLKSMFNAQAYVLIGLNNAKVMTTSQNVEAEDDVDAPIAGLTKFGWIVYGPENDKNKSKGKVQSNYHEVRINHHHIVGEANDADANMHELVKNFFAVENFGVLPTAPLIAEEEKRALKIIHETLTFKDKRYSIGLLWRDDDQELPDNFDDAVKRLISDEKRLEKLGLVQWKKELIEAMLAKGYIRKATEKDLKTKWPRVWYCPMFVTFNENKVPPKPRNVSDTAAKSRGISLNNCLLKGPELLIPLIRSLLHLRDHEFGFAADCKENFHQFLIQSPDDQCQRFLYRDGDPNVDPKDAIYIFQVCMFGPTCSPTLTQFIKNIHAENYRETCPEAFEAVTRYTYVDDLSDSQPSLELATKCAMDSIKIYKDMSCDLIGFVSNSAELLKSLPKENVNENCMSMGFDPNTEQITKILGLRWDLKDDVFTFKLKEDNNFEQLQEGKLTKRRLTRCVMQVYDPLGFVAHIMIRGKFLIRELWKAGLGWDQCAKEQFQKLWQEFAQELKSIVNVRIPRWISGTNPLRQVPTLHIFVDASDIAYAAGGYLRFPPVNEHKKFRTTLAMAKSRIAPIKYLSIPRLELMAAVLGVRLANLIQKHLSYKVASIQFYSDSRTVLSWICSKEYKFKIFVAARIGEILESTTTSQWNYVKSADNIADDFTKFKGVRLVSEADRVFNGPEFMSEEHSHWPTKSAITVEPTEEEKVTSNTYIHHIVIDDTTNALTGLEAKNFKNWDALVEHVAVLLREKGETAGGGFITATERRNAHYVLFKKIQHDTYSEIISELKSIESLKNQNRPVGEINQLYKEACGDLLQHRHVVAKDGLLRSLSRVQDDELSFDYTNPPILNGRHQLVEFMIKQFHENNFHSMDQTVLMDLRQSTLIMGAAGALERVKKSCHECVLSKLKPVHPVMGEVPKCRRDFEKRPWTHVGIDAFGPITVKKKNSKVKKKVYGLIFTCLTWRAVHIEMVNSMTADDCMIAVRNFWFTRTIPRHFYTDNGKNLLGSSRLMSKDFTDLLEELGEQVAKEKMIEWHFIPAYSPALCQTIQRGRD